MQRRTVSRWITIGLFAFAAAGFRVGVAVAQQGGGRNPDMRSDQRANLTPEEQVRESSRMINTMQNIRRSVSDMLDRARQERDIIRLNCLNDKLTQIDVTVRSSADHRVLLNTAVSLQNNQQSNHEYNLITIYRQRVDTLELEARQCIGEETGVFGEQLQISLRPNPNVPPESTTDYPRDPEMLPEAPPTMSPVR